MDENLALSFARASLSLYQKDQTFALELPSRSEADLVAQAFRQLGCIADVDRFKYVVTVQCIHVPSQATEGFVRL